MTEVKTRNIMDYFPLPKARKNQIQVLQAIQKAFDEGYKNVLLEAPVGSGKSAIAVTMANFYGDAHILTPRKSLQDQYLEDFAKQDIVLMKGRGAYPCTYPNRKNPEYQRVVEIIEKGAIARVGSGQKGCDAGPCKGNRKVYVECTDFDEGEATFPCPYNVAIEVAQQRKAVIHNLHSFIFQGFFAARFQTRRILIIDECHEMENIIRGFAEVKFHIPLVFTADEIPSRDDMKTLSDWNGWFLQFSDKFSDTLDKDGSSERGAYLEHLQKLEIFSEQFGEKFVMSWEEGHNGRYTKFAFIPEQIGHLSNKYLLDFGEKRLLMSGTVYNKQLFCKNNGLIESETCFMRIGSTFPQETRPIYFKPDYAVDTSHKTWDANFKEVIEKIETVFDIFHDVKGLIHTPSYRASHQMYSALKHTERVVMHEKEDFGLRLQEFYDSKEPLVFLSPICQQGVDFKYDRARFQIVTRVPYPNTSDAFVEHKVKNDFPWYNYQALVAFGQQIGRVNRAEDDFGVTVLMDERFGKFLSRNRSILPKWLSDAVIYK